MWHTNLFVIHTGSDHVRASDRLYLLDALEPLLRQQLVEVSKDLVEQPHAFYSLVVDVQFFIEL